MHRSLHCLVAGCFWLLGSCAAAEDHFLIIGGGPSPFNNQVSLESNVLFSQRVLDRVREDALPRQTFFADGKIDKPDLQFLDPDIEPAPAVLWMSRIFGDEDAIQHCYRNHHVSEIEGPTRKGYLKQAFFELAERLGEGDRLIVYVTAHGGAAEAEFSFGEDDEALDDASDANPHDTTIALWGDGSLSVSEFDVWLNKFSPDVRVVLIMAQCHSGGFAHAIFHHADEDRGLNPQLRAGFFSQRHDRAAAGCTPDINENNYQEYSTYFWEAIGGTTRGGEPIELPDFDGDGKVSFAEAHAHAVIASDSIDIPITTSDAFLREFSEIAPTDSDAGAEQDQKGLFGSLFGGSGSAGAKEQPEEEITRPLGRDRTVAQVTALARPEQKAIVSHLTEALEVETEEPVAEVRRRAQKLEEDAEAASQLWTTAAVLVASERRSLAGSLSLQWPALRSRTFSPQMNRLAGTEGKQFVDYVESHPESDAYLQAKERAGDLEEKMREAKHREAKMRRLLRTLENVLLEHNLQHHASAAQLGHFGRLMALQEEGVTTADSH